MATRTSIRKELMARMLYDVYKPLDKAKALSGYSQSDDTLDSCHNRQFAIRNALLSAYVELDKFRDTFVSDWNERMKDTIEKDTMVTLSNTEAGKMIQDLLSSNKDNA